MFFFGQEVQEIKTSLILQGLRRAGRCGSCRLAGMGQPELRTQPLFYILAAIFRRLVGRYDKLAIKLNPGTFQRGRICLTFDFGFGNIGLVRWARPTAGSPADIGWWRLVYAAVEASQHSLLEGEAFVELHWLRLSVDKLGA